MRRFVLLFCFLLAAGCSANMNFCKGTAEDTAAFDGRVDNCGATEENADGDVCDDVVWVSEGPVDGYYEDCDCDDNDASVYPDAPTYCDGDVWADRNCDGVPDGNACDDDGDGFTDDDGDCNDGDVSASPDSPEYCGDPGGVDNDCDGLGDTEDPDCLDEGDTGDTATH